MKYHWYEDRGGIQLLRNEPGIAVPFYKMLAHSFICQLHVSYLMILNIQKQGKDSDVRSQFILI